MLFRAIALSLALLVGIGSIIPVVNDTAEAKPRYKSKKKYKKLKKYSKAWWRWYRKEQRKKRAVLARKRALRAKQILLARQKAKKPEKKVENISAKTTKFVKANDEKPKAVNELQFPLNDSSGKSLGTVLLSVVGQAIQTESNQLQRIGGVSTSSLRQNAVLKMVKNDGWIVNDYHKIVSGKKVYIVVGESQSKGVMQSHLFYFTEIDGKIYSLSSSSPNNAQERLAQESERMIQSLQRGDSSNLIGLK
jgi:hypothetical protein